MVNKLKLMTIVGTRPEIIRLSETIKACDRFFNHILVHTGQNWDYELNQIFFDELGLREPDVYLNSPGANLGDTMGNIIAQSYRVLNEVRPDALLILGDTNSCLSAISAKRLKIPIFHMEAGNRCFDLNVPEEINRRIVDHVSDVNLAYTEHSRRYLLAEGIRKEHVFVTGSPMTEVLRTHEKSINESTILIKLNLETQSYFVVSVHREENIDNEETFNSLIHALNEVARFYQFPIVFSTHPRTWQMIEKRGVTLHPLIKQLKPFGFFDYVNLQKNSKCVLSDSGTLSEESSILGFPGVLIRTSTERPEVLDKGTIVIGGINELNIKRGIELACGLFKMNHIVDNRPIDYDEKVVSQKVVALILSYTQIINRIVWNKTY